MSNMDSVSSQIKNVAQGSYRWGKKEALGTDAANYAKLLDMFAAAPLTIATSSEQILE